MSSKIEEFGFEVVHLGVNCNDDLEAKEYAKFFLDFFNFANKDGKDSIYAGPFLEFMKGSGRGTHGHIALATDDIIRAQSYFKKQGLEFDSDSKKYNKDGKLIVIYLKNEIGGFALHFLQK